ncbi:MAG: efflux RND transporter permease subunit [Vicinamibacterales bacterium]
MAHGHSDADLVRQTHNTARFFTENRQIAWVLLAVTLIWGVFGYIQMPKRKDPVFPVIYAAAVTVWPGASAERIEQLVTRKIEEKMAENPRVERIESTSRSNVSIVVIALDEKTTEPAKEWDDIALRLNGIRDLPPGAGPVEFIKDFGDTATLMLTVASPKVDAVGLAIRAGPIRRAIEAVRATVPAAARARRVSMIVAFPPSLDSAGAERHRDLVSRVLTTDRLIEDARPLGGPGFVGIDFNSVADRAALSAALHRVMTERLAPAEYHPDIWDAAIVADPAQTEAALTEVAGDRYTYRELDQFTDVIKRTLQTVPEVSKVFRAGLLPEQIFLDYSQEALTTAGVPLARLAEILNARNITLPGGMLDVQGKSLLIDPSGEFHSAADIGNVIVSQSPSGMPVYLRDAVDITRGYQTPRYLNYYYARDKDQAWRRGRSITLAVQMRPGQQVGDFGAAVDAALRQLAPRLPVDLQLARPSDQPLQVRENVGLFMRSLYEAIALVILVALVGFWEWRSALVIACAIPLTLAMTFGLMDILGIDIQQVSVASLIIALGLLVDDPVVAGDAIKRELDHGQPNVVAAWLGPTKLATAILFATITNIVAYLPLLLLKSQTGAFIYSLPVVLACSLIASRVVSMTFLPLLGYYLLRPSKRSTVPAQERRERGFTGAYYRTVGWAIDHRWVALAGALALLIGGGLVVTRLRVQFFPKDLSYLSYVDVWLPEDATIGATNATAVQAEAIIRRVSDEYSAHHTGEDGKPADVLLSVTSFIGGGGPRFWFSVAPELFQPNYAQLIINVRDKHDTAHLVDPWQRALSAGIPGARLDVRQLETGKPIGIPVAVRLSGESIPELRRLAEEVKGIFRTIPAAVRIRDDWGADSFKVKLEVDPDRANFAGVSNLDVALSSVTGMTGFPVTTLREGNLQIPIVARLRVDERARMTDVQNLYVYPLQGTTRVPLQQVSRVKYQMDTEKIRRRNQFRTITVSAFPEGAALPSEVLSAARERLDRFAATLPSGYVLHVGGEEEEQTKGFAELSVVMLVSVMAIFLALVIQFKSAVKPLVVFSAIPFGIVGALVSLIVMDAPFGFMAFLGVASLIGVIVSHVIVLFDFIEEMHAEGEPLRDALLDAGIVRLRPVMITVGATVFGLIPLALHGGPLWEGLCYTQIGGLTVATFVTLILVPVLYAIFVLDLGIIKWEAPAATTAGTPA